MEIIRRNGILLYFSRITEKSAEDSYCCYSPSIVIWRKKFFNLTKRKKLSKRFSLKTVQRVGTNEFLENAMMFPVFVSSFRTLVKAFRWKTWKREHKEQREREKEKQSICDVFWNYRSLTFPSAAGLARPHIRIQTHKVTKILHRR